MDAMDFANSMRGQYILGQALYRAIEAMKEDERPEWSNIDDMEFLMRELFPMFSAIMEVCSHGPDERIVDDEE